MTKITESAIELMAIQLAQRRYSNTKRVQGDDRGDWVWYNEFKNPNPHHPSRYFIAEVDAWRGNGENVKKLTESDFLQKDKYL